MQYHSVFGESGYAIPCISAINGQEKTVCIISHGFGSSKESTTAMMLLRELPQKGIGAIAFDFPAHGSSPVDGDKLRVEACIQTLADVEAHVRETVPEAEVVYFSSSFGAYINLQYLSGGERRKRHTGKSFLRSAAVNMPELFLNPTEKEQEELREKGFIMLEYDTRPIKLTTAFVDDLAHHDLFQRNHVGGDRICMIHGEADETILVQHARRFAEKFQIPLTIVPGGDHSLSIPGAPEQVLEHALRFFGCNE
ncbi:MAG: alpha/beta hydrolase [Oscillospiraceae bacterium]|nr:alpha/beta hydrolase [Oscillospiraceae bacterium]